MKNTSALLLTISDVYDDVVVMLIVLTSLLWFFHPLRPNRESKSMAKTFRVMPALGRFTGSRHSLFKCDNVTIVAVSPTSTRPST